MTTLDRSTPKRRACCAKPQHAAEGEQENRNHPGDWTPPAEPDGAVTAQWRNGDEQANRTKPGNGDGDGSDAETLAGVLDEGEIE